MATRKTNDRLILGLHAGGMSQREIAHALGCSKTAILKRLRILLSTGGHLANNHQNSDGVMKRTTNISMESGDAKTQRYLRIIGTNQIYIWTELRAAKKHFEEVEWDGEKFILVTRSREIETQMISEKNFSGGR